MVSIDIKIREFVIGTSKTIHIQVLGLLEGWQSWHISCVWDSLPVHHHEVFSENKAAPEAKGSEEQEEWRRWCLRPKCHPRLPLDLQKTCGSVLSNSGFVGSSTATALSAPPNTIDWVDYKKIEFFFSQFWWLISPKSKCWKIHCVVRVTFWLIDGSLLALSSHDRREKT